MTSRGEVHVLGAGGHAKVVVRTLQELGFSVAAIFNNNPKLWRERLLGIPIVGPLGSTEQQGRLPTLCIIHK